MFFRFFFCGFLALLSCDSFGEELGRKSGGQSGGQSEVVVSVAQAGEAFVVDATIDAHVTLKTGWEVLTDFNHMTAILNNLSSSSLLSRDGNTLIVKQEGIARYGFLSFPFQSVREVRLEPMTRIRARIVSGTAKRMDSEATLSQTDQHQGLHIKYRAEIVPDSALAHLFGASFLRHEVEEQFQLLVAEMKRRDEIPTAIPPPNQRPGE